MYTELRGKKMAASQTKLQRYLFWTRIKHSHSCTCFLSSRVAWNGFLIKSACVVHVIILLYHRYIPDLICGDLDSANTDVLEFYRKKVMADLNHSLDTTIES